MLPSCDPNDGEGTMRLLEDLTTNAGQVQQQVLTEILTRNAGTEYLRGFLGGRVDRHLFKEKVPIVDYEQVKPYIERLANGEPSSIISSQPISELLTRYVQGLDQGKGMYLLFIKPEISTPSGLVARPVLTSYYKSSHFRNRPFNKFNVYTSPDETILCPDSKQSMYCQLLCGLVQRGEVLRVGAVFASAFLRAVKFLEDHWRELCANIRAGSLSDWITDAGCRAAVLAGALKQSDTELASAIAAECGRSSWEGIIKKLWPRTKYVDVIVTGSMAQYIPTLEFYSGGLPLVSTMYASSECFFGINLRPLSLPSDVSYTLLPNMAYFEFLPVEKDTNGAQVEHVECNGKLGNDVRSKALQRQQQQLAGAAAVDLVDVEPGRHYELLVTTFTGLYRYRVGDILMVTGFHNAAPQFRFLHRRNVVLSVDTDKTNEEDLLRAVTQAKRLLEPLGCLLAEYTSYADTLSIPGHYVLFWELKARGGGEEHGTVDARVMEGCCEAVEGSLDAVYRRCRSKDRSVGPLEIRVVKQGTFDSLMDFCVLRGSSVNQYKTPRCIKCKEAIELLDSRVVGRFFSKNTPLWQPMKIGS
ncbi:hypothetical protein Taro_020055 [Colocasia esculenta]|uniref:Indole-3-acetic acid-amido synthetase GH3.17 n=1 Tax=Colocasia esculenta TaxID=4460 RepID=A0A843UVE6_COLES|nr:hypothetical protein [Colocasia esculenta]